MYTNSPVGGNPIDLPSIYASGNVKLPRRMSNFTTSTWSSRAILVIPIPSPLPNHNTPTRKNFQVTNTGQLNTILTFYEITEPEVQSDISGLPLPLLKRALAVLVKSGRAQLIESTDGTGVRFFAR